MNIRFFWRNVVKTVACLAVTVFFASCDLFEPETYTLTTTVNPENAGTVSRNPDKAKYDDNETVTMTATAYDGYTFDGWYDSGVEKLSGSASFDVTMTADKYMESYEVTDLVIGKPDWDGKHLHPITGDTYIDVD